MSVLEALNLVSTSDQAAELFFTTSEMPGYTTFSGHPSATNRKTHAENGLKLINGAGIVASGSSKCSTGNGDGSIAALAVELSWPYEDGTCDAASGAVDWTTNEAACYTTIKPSYREAMQEVLGSEPGGNYCASYGGSNNGSLDYYQDCGHFVATVVRKSGADPDFPLSHTGTMLAYLDQHKEKWTEIDNLGNTSNLEPGDIFVISSAEIGHIMIYTGSYSQYGDLASASLCGRTSNMGNVYFGDHRGTYHIFRRIKEDKDG